MSTKPPLSVLFLCTGNHFRSRFAEILFNSVADKMRLPWRASSRGLALERGLHNVGPLADSALAGLKALGVPTSEAMTRPPLPVSSEDLQRADRIIALKQTEHQPLLQERFPAWVDKAEFWQVNNAPEALTLIEREVMGLIARLLGGTSRTSETDAKPPTPTIPEPPSRKALTAKVGRETAGRRGKGVTTIFDLPLNDSNLRELAGILKQRCGTGGTVKDGRIEIQGDQRERIVAELEKLGYKVKRVGG